jgi:hypothetical protein
MFKSVLLIALGVAAASANFLSVDFERYLQVTAATSVNSTCTRNTTGETCGAGFCCATYSRNGFNMANSVCFPAEFHQQTFANVSGFNYTVFCNFPNTTSTIRASQTACNDTTPCATGTKCCSRSWTLGNSAGSSASRSFCVAGNTGNYVWANLNVTNLTAEARVSSVCPVDTNVEGDGSFGAYVKTSAMMLVALIAAAFF